jgi:hypothetical protein
MHEPTQDVDNNGVRNRLIAAAICAAILVASYLYAPVCGRGPVLCPTRSVTGIPCPSCGMTRAFCAMARGDVSTAAGHHLLSPVLFVFVLVTVPLLVYEAVRRRRVAWFHVILFSRRLAYGLVAFLLLYHGFRLYRLAATGQFTVCLNQSVFAWLGRTLSACFV